MNKYLALSVGFLALGIASPSFAETVAPAAQPAVAAPAAPATTAATTTAMAPAKVVHHKAHKSGKAVETSAKAGTTEKVEAKAAEKAEMKMGDEAAVPGAGAPAEVKAEAKTPAL